MYSWTKVIVSAIGLKTPYKFNFNGIDYWFSVINGKPNVFKDQCAHMGNNLSAISDGFICNQHGWIYDLKGDCKNVPGQKIIDYKCRFDSKGNLEVYLPLNTKKEYKELKVSSNLDLKIHSHACLELIYKETSVLFDPWLSGTTYYNSWKLFPKPIIIPEELNPTIIIITHPHPDHFHLQTLDKLNKKIPIYFPIFSSNIIENGLRSLGFKNINPVPWNEKVTIQNFLYFKFLRPRSMWEDSATLIVIDDNSTNFVWLNQVDAGQPYDIDEIGNVDLISTAFDQGASGWPLTWTNISEQRKNAILKNSKESNLKSFISLSQKLNAKYFLPFAGHWRLCQKDHQIYSQKIPHTSFDEITNNFQTNYPQCKVLDIYPGESFNFFNNQFSVNEFVRRELNHSILLEESYEQIEESSYYNLIHSFESLMNNLVARSKQFNCEAVLFEILIKENSKIFTYDFSPDNVSKIKVRVKIPFYIFKLLAQNVANWDHIAIGYWGEWERDSETYPANFMRLLQTGMLRQKSHLNFSSDILKKPVAEIIENLGDRAIGALTRIGLPCVSCTRNNLDTLEDVLKIHDVNLKHFDWLLNELSYEQK